MPTWIPYCFTALSLIGAFVNSRGNLLLSSYLWLFANSFWLYLDAANGLYAQSMLYMAFIAMNALGIYTSLKDKADA